MPQICYLLLHIFLSKTIGLRPGPLVFSQAGVKARCNMNIFLYIKEIAQRLHMQANSGNVFAYT